MLSHVSKIVTKTSWVKQPRTGKEWEREGEATNPIAHNVMKQFADNCY